MDFSQAIEIDAGDEVCALTFTANGEHLVSGSAVGAQVWRVRDGKRVATMRVGNIQCFAVSRDGRFIAAGSYGDVLVWDATNYERVFVAKIPGGPIIRDVDFSPDSSRFVSAGKNETATIWDVVGQRKVRTLDHGQPDVLTAKYSPQGDRVATATKGSVRVWDASDGRLLVNVEAQLRPFRGLIWFNNHLFVKTDDSKIKQIDVSTGSTVFEYLVPSNDAVACIGLPQHGQFIAHSTNDDITFWSTSTHAELGLIPRRSRTRAIAFAPDDQLAIVVQEHKIVFSHPLFLGELDIRIERPVLHAWENGQLTQAGALLAASIPRSKDNYHHVLASRALIRARLQQWDEALVDAEESIETHSSTLGYVAKCVALVGKGDTHAACRVWDIAALLFHSDRVSILLVKAVVLFMVGDHDDAISRIDDLITIKPSDPALYVVQAYMRLLRGSRYMEGGNYNRAIQLFQDAQLGLGDRKERPPLIIGLISGWKFDTLATTIYQRLCEALFEVGRTKDASDSVLRMVGEEISMSEPIKTWASDFMQRCLSGPEKNYNKTAGHDGASHPMTPLLREWAKLKLSAGSWKDALASAAHFVPPKFIVYQVICERLEMTGRSADAAACFREMCSKLAQDTGQAYLTFDFKSRWGGKLEDLGDNAMYAKRYDEAILQYTTALSFNAGKPQDLLGKRSKAFASKGEWAGALNDANKVTELDPSSPLGYKRKHEALRGMGKHDEAAQAFKDMLSKMSESSDTLIRERSHRYIKTEEAIRTTIDNTIRDFPLVLIDTARGCLCDKSEQVSAFQRTPTFMELFSSMTTQIDHPRIEREVEKYFRYATFSHRWEKGEPLFEEVIKVLVHDLKASPAHEKLQMFCKIVREAGFSWAWSDTCCIDKGDHFILQEALVSMFKWYEHSAMTIIHLRGVNRLAVRGALTKSIWNMRAWTLQEYHASKVVRIYTEDWTPYLGLNIYNHKDSPEIVSEMEEATGISAQDLMALRPGLDDIRAKLRLASTRQATRVEDAAYSLLGIFSMSLPVTYGEGDKALGRLLAQLLTSSGETSILAWTGRSGSFNSCLPFSITVFSELPTSHIPLAVPDAEVGAIYVGVRSLDHNSLVTLYDRVNELQVPSISGHRLKLPCLTFKARPAQLVLQNGSERVFRVQTNVLGTVEIRTKEDLSQLGSLCFAHPWIDFLLDRRSVRNVPESIAEETDDGSSVVDASPGTSRQAKTPRLMRIKRSSGGRPTQDAGLHRFNSVPSTTEKQRHVLHFIARLRKQFGALLLTPTRSNVDEYRRVAAESLVTVQVQELTQEVLEKLIRGVRMVDVL